MSTLATYLEAADQAVTALMKECNGPALRTQMSCWQAGLLRALQEAEKLSPTNGTIWRARDWVEQLSKSPHSPVTNAANSKVAYLSDLGNVKNWIAIARQDASSAPPSNAISTPTNRAAWTLDDWQKYDSEGLQNMLRANTPQFQLLYKQAYGKDYAPLNSHNKPR